MSKRIENILYKALLLNGKMERALYEYEFKEHIEYWKRSMRKDSEDFVFVVTENNGDAAMFLITNKDKLFINEKARQRLQLYWKSNYEKNIELLLPAMAKELANGILPVTGVKFIPLSVFKKNKLTWNKSAKNSKKK